MTDNNREVKTKETIVTVHFAMSTSEPSFSSHVGIMQSVSTVTSNCQQTLLVLFAKLP